MATAQEIGEKIYNARQLWRISQAKLAAELGVQTPIIYKYEKGLIKTIPFSKRSKICEILHISPLDLLYDDEIGDVNLTDPQVGVFIKDWNKATKDPYSSTLGEKYIKLLFDIENELSESDQNTLLEWITAFLSARRKKKPYEKNGIFPGADGLPPISTSEKEE